MAEVRLLQLEPEGIGGWLVLPLIGLILWPLSFLYTLWVDVLPCFQADVWRALTTPVSQAYSPYWAPYLIATAILAVALIVWAIAILVLFLQRRRQVPLVISLFYLATAAVALFDFLSVRYLSGQVPLLAESALVQGAPSDLVRSLVVPLIWIPYFRRSVRVRNTFTR